MSQPISRRDALRRTAAVAAVVSTPAASSFAQTAPPTTTPATPAPATQPLWMTAEDIAVLDKFTDQQHEPAIREQMARNLASTRRSLQAVRKLPIVDGAAPAFHFDPFAPGIAPPARVETKCELSKGELPAYDGNIASLAFASLVDLHRLLMAKKITSLQLTQMYLDRIKRIAPKLFCIITLTESLALEQARAADERIARGETGPLLGIPYGLKDLFAAKGTPMTMGAAPYKDNVTDYDAEIVKKLRDAGAVLMAKTSLGELGWADRWFGGQTRNPWNTELGSSGSSAGSASGVAAGLFAFAIGTEVYGSIISPSNACGATGLRSTFGRISRGGGVALSWTMDRIGPIARSVEDCAAVFHALHGKSDVEQDASYRHVPFAWDGTNTSLDGIRIGIDTTGFKGLRRDTALFKENAEAQDAAVAAIEKLAARKLVPITMPSSADYYGLIGLIVNCEGSAAFADLRRSGNLPQLVRQGDDHWPTIFRVCSEIPASDYIRGMQARLRLQYEMDKAMADVDVYLTPPGSGPSLPFNNLCGHPAILTRCGRRADGRPIGFSVVGKLDREDLVLRVARAFERATDWHKLWPTNV